MSNLYKDLKDKQQKEFDEFPKFFAFDDKQFEEGLNKLGYTLQDMEDGKVKIVHIGAGCYMTKDDVERFENLSSAHQDEMKAEIEKDTTGEGFIKDMFEYELANHEYGYTGELEDTLDALDLTYEDLEKPNIAHGLELAKEIFKEKEEEGLFGDNAQIRQAKRDSIKKGLYSEDKELAEYVIKIGDKYLNLVEIPFHSAENKVELVSDKAEASVGRNEYEIQGIVEAAKKLGFDTTSYTVEPLNLTEDKEIEAEDIEEDEFEVNKCTKCGSEDIEFGEVESEMVYDKEDPNQYSEITKTPWTCKDCGHNGIQIITPPVLEESKLQEANEDDEIDEATQQDIEELEVKEEPVETEEDPFTDEEGNEKSLLDLLQDRIGQEMSVGELNTVLQALFSKFNEVFLLTSDLYNMDPSERQDLVIFDDDDMYTITYKIKDIDDAIIEITDVTVE